MRILVTLALIPAVLNAFEWQSNVEALLQAEADSAWEALLDRVISRRPPWREVFDRLAAIRFEDATGKGELLLRTTMCIDGVERPWVVYVPRSYDSARPTPLLMVLHGGVGRSELFDDPLGDAEDNEFLPLAKEKGWFVVYPFGQFGATWWDEVGMANIHHLIRRMKQEYNIDDDRVWMAGFSDGASAGFAFAMVNPNDFGAFVALNGHMGVGSVDGDLPTFAPNLSNTPIYAITTDRDGLYPSEKMRPAIDMARSAGGDIFYRELAGEHEFSYSEEELPRIGSFLERHPRNPLPSRIVWEAAKKKYGRCRWIALDEITLEEPADWHRDFNAPLGDDRITIGFIADDSFEGEGVRVDKLAGEGTLAERSGLQAGDVIIRGGKQEVLDMDDLVAFKATLTRGDHTEMTVLREGKQVVLQGQVPEAEYHYVFKRQRPSGIVEASFSGNLVDVRTSRVGKLRILVHPDMFTLDRTITVRVNGDVVFDDLVMPDLEYMLRTFLENRDRKELFVAEILIDLSP